MGNSPPNPRRNVIRGIVALIIILIILLCLRLCKHDKEEVPTPQPTPSASIPQDTIKQDTATVFPKAWQKVSKPKRKRKVIAASVLQPAKEVAVPEKKKTNAIIKEMSQEFSSSSSMNLRGIEDVRSWSVDKDDYEVVGVIRYYSRDSIEAANEKFNPKTQTNEKKSNKKATPGVKKSNNLSVDDF